MTIFEDPGRHLEGRYVGPEVDLLELRVMRPSMSTSPGNGVRLVDYGDASVFNHGVLVEVQLSIVPIGCLDHDVRVGA